MRVGRGCGYPGQLIAVRSSDSQEAVVMRGPVESSVDCQAKVGVGRNYTDGEVGQSEARVKFHIGGRVGMGSTEDNDFCFLLAELHPRARTPCCEKAERLL
jgi:hypothetical protein